MRLWELIVLSDLQSLSERAMRGQVLLTALQTRSQRLKGENGLWSLVSGLNQFATLDLLFGLQHAFSSVAYIVQIYLNKESISITIPIYEGRCFEI